MDFERTLRAYSSMNAAYQGDETIKGDKEERQNNQCISIHASNFLKRTATVMNAKGRVLVTSRLFPSDLRARNTDEMLEGCQVYELTAMDKEDAVKFFQSQGIKGTRAEIEMSCESYGYHPLSLQLLAGRIIKDRRNPYDISVAQKIKINSDLKGEHQNHILKVAYEVCRRHAASYSAK